MLMLSYFFITRRIKTFYVTAIKNNEKAEDLKKLHMKNVLKAIEIFQSENIQLKKMKGLVKIPMVLIIIASAIIGSIYVSFLKGFTT